MDGVGSRLGRASSRYGPPTVFNGPVRKWKKRWVHAVSYHNNNCSRPNNGNGRGGGGSSSTTTTNTNNASSLILCRWTPISPTHTANSDDNSVKPEEPPRRKFRYTPIVVLEQEKEAAGKVDDKAKTSRVHSLTIGTTTKSNDAYEKPNSEGAFMEEIQAANKNRLARQHSTTSHLNLDMGFKGHNENHEPDDENKEAELG